jgi:CDP-2,3-bis-(O-geranylgeranyl)-sn-glycerol synthase
VTRLLVEVLWFLFPAGAANMAPIFAAKLLPSWNWPVDFNYKFHGKRIFGEHKTIRGFVSGILLGEAAFVAMQFIALKLSLGTFIPRDEFLQVSSLFGAWMGFCALGGDAAKSFLKRRRGISPGKSWIPFDQIDWIVGAIAGALPFLPLTPAHILTSLFVAFVSSASARALGFILKINDAAI